MKNVLFSFLLISLLAISCSKSNNDDNQPAIETKFMTTASGTTWTYEDTDSSTTPVTVTANMVTSTDRDTTIGTRVYHVYSNSATGSSSYYNISGNDYYIYTALPAALGNVQVENLYLKTSAAVNESWTQNYTVTPDGFPFPVPITMTNTIKAKGLSVLVNGKTYTDVINVQTAISTSLIPASDLTTNLQYYYAPKYGLIQSSNKIDVNFMGVEDHTNTRSILKTSSIL